MRISRRNFLKVSGSEAVAAAVASQGLVTRAVAFAQRSWQYEVDIAVIGSGAAGNSAVLNADRLGNKVLLMEKSSLYGGTTVKSGGQYWIPNNPIMRAQGLQDSRDDALRYMARTGFPTRYNPAASDLGIGGEDYELLTAFYDNGSDAAEALHSMTTIRPSLHLDADGTPSADYRSDLPESRMIRGRSLNPNSLAKKKTGTGGDLIEQMRKAIVQRGIPVLMRHRAERLIWNKNGEIVGLEANSPRDETISIRIRKAVIFCSGGFTHNRGLRTSFLRGPIFGGCAVPTNEGDFVEIASAAGAKLVNMSYAWWAEAVLEQCLKSKSTATDVFFVRGTSTIVVDRFGRRIVNEKMNYNDRTQIHFVWDPGRDEYRNLLTFMIYDRTTAEQSAGSFPIPRPGDTSSYAISGNTIEELSKAIQSRLESLAEQIAGFQLDSGFASQLRDTIMRFNHFAEQGVDDDFHRGETPYERAQFDASSLQAHRNPSMTPISTEGPFYAIILAAATLDTHGGPRINGRAQVIRQNGKPIPGLYGAGNCIGFGGQGYWGYGGTIGPAIAFGYIAAREATKEPVKVLDQGC